ncbi:unnamed protein product [Colias eurytheme]|nr:unnamed protein product [Colias eurytheme]
MSSSESRKKTYTEEDLEKALNEIKGKKKSVRQICKEFSIPKTTILDKISGRRPGGIKKPGPRPALGVNGEKKVVEWLLNISKCGFPVKKQELLQTIEKIINEGEIKNNFKDNRPGEKWFKKFLARNKVISLKNAEGINKARARVTEQSIRLWFRQLEEYLESINQKEILSEPMRICNGDVSGFALCPKTGKVLGPRGFKNLHQIKPNNEKENITVLLTFNANGDMCPPCVVFPYIRPPKAVVDSMPQEWCLGKSETGRNSSIDCELDATKELTISSLREEVENQNNEANSNPIVQVQTVSAQIHSTPKQFTQITTKNSNTATVSSKFEYNEIIENQGNSATIDSNKKDLFPDLSLSTLHLSDSYFDVGSIVSLDDVLILPLQDIASTSNTEEIIETPMNSTIYTAKCLSSETSPSALYAANNKQPCLAVVEELNQNKNTDPFKNHLMLPDISNNQRKINQRTPAAISSFAWRKYYEDKEKIKNEKQEAIRKRKLERIERNEQKKSFQNSQTLRRTAPKRKKKINPLQKDTQETFEKENLPAVNRLKCPECDDVLISDVEDDNEKNIGCDKCDRWYHLKCTRFVGLSYLDVKDTSFECDYH